MALVGAANEMDASKRAEIAALVQKELKFRAQLSGTTIDVSRWAGKGNKSISFPRLGSFTAEERAAGAAFTEQVAASSVDTLDLDKRVGVHYIVDPDEEVESVLNWEVELAQRAGSAIGRKLDLDIISRLESEAEPLVAAVGDISRDFILDMREYLLNNEADLDLEGFILLGVDQEKAMLKIDEFKRQDIYGPNGAVRQGQLGTIYNMPVIRHSGLAASTYYMYVRPAIAYGLQKAPRLGSQPAVEYGADAEKVTLNHKYGVKCTQIGEGTASAGKSAWAIKDNNV